MEEEQCQPQCCETNADVVPKGTMTDEEFNALGIVCKMLHNQLKRNDVQNPNFPYLMATSIDLDGRYGKEALERK